MSTVDDIAESQPPTAPARRTRTTSTGTRRSTGCSSTRSPRRCRPSARWRGPTSTTVTGSPRAASMSSSSRAARRCPTTTTSTVSARATRASRFRRRNGPPSCAAASWRWTSPSTACYRGALNPYLSPAAIKRWQPFVDEIVRAALDEKIESGRIDFVDDLANIVPAVLTLAMMGIELQEVAGLQRARAPLGVHAGTLSRRRARRRDEPADGHRHDQHDDGDPGESAARPGQRAAAAAHRRRARARSGDPRQPGADHRRRLRHHHRADRALVGVAVGTSGSARAAQPRT